MRRVVTYVRQRVAPRRAKEAAGFQNYTEANNAEIVKSFEVSESDARSPFNHDSPLLQALNLLARRLADTLMVEVGSDISDSPLDQELVARLVGMYGAKFIVIREPNFGIDDRSARIGMSLDFFLNQERAFRMSRLRDARACVKTSTGRCEGRRAYGNAKEPHKASAEKETIARMKHLRRGGHSYAKIAEILNAEGISPQSGSRWWGKTVNLILQRTSEDDESLRF